MNPGNSFADFIEYGKGLALLTKEDKKLKTQLKYQIDLFYLIQGFAIENLLRHTFGSHIMLGKTYKAIADVFRMISITYQNLANVNKKLADLNRIVYPENYSKLNILYTVSDAYQVISDERATISYGFRCIHNTYLQITQSLNDHLNRDEPFSIWHYLNKNSHQELMTYHNIIGRSYFNMHHSYVILASLETGHSELISLNCYIYSCKKGVETHNFLMTAHMKIIDSIPSIAVWRRNFMVEEISG